MVVDDIQDFLPHRGAMCLLERIVARDGRGMTLATRTHTSPANPLRHDGRLRAIHLCEYGAQAMAVHGGLAAREAGGVAKPGLLVSLREVVLSVECVESLGGELLVEVEQLEAGAAGLQYSFRVTHQGAELARGRVAVLESTNGLSQ